MTSRSRETAEQAALEPSRPGRLHQPWRAVVALVELVLAALAVWLAFGMWSEGITVIPTPDGQGGFVKLTRYHGDLLGGAIGLGLVAGLLVLDAARQALLALRVRSRQRRDAEEGWPAFDEDA
ncbi:MAG: hypothetical protein ACRDQB_08665 [Thermocrispum sp.]